MALKNPCISPRRIEPHRLLQGLSEIPPAPPMMITQSDHGSTGRNPQRVRIGKMGGRGNKSESRLRREAILTRMQRFAESGEATEVFDKQVKKNPKWAFEAALDRVYGKATQPVLSASILEIGPELRAAINQALGLPPVVVDVPVEAVSEEK